MSGDEFSISNESESSNEECEDLILEDEVSDIEPDEEEDEDKVNAPVVKRPAAKNTS